MKEILESKKYRAVFEGQRGSYDTSYSDHAYYREYTVHYLNINVLIKDRVEEKQYFSRFRAEESEWEKKIPSVREAVFPYDENRIIPERRDALIDYLLDDVVQRIKAEDEDSIPAVAVNPPGIDDLVQRGFLYNESGGIETLFPVTQEEAGEDE